MTVITTRLPGLGRALALGGALLALTAGAEARDLTVVSWGGTFQDAQRELFIKPFAAKLGKPVLDESWDGGYGVLQSKVKAGTPNWDVVQVEAEELALGCADGIYEKIDWDKLGGKDAYIEAGASDCGAGHIVWSVALTYDGNRLTGTSEVPLSTAPKGAVQLTAPDGTTASGKFN